MKKIFEGASELYNRQFQGLIPQKVVTAGLIIIVIGFIFSAFFNGTNVNTVFLLAAFLAVIGVILLLKYQYLRMAGFVLSGVAFSAVFFNTVWLDYPINNATHVALALIIPFWLIVFSEREAFLVGLLIYTYLLGYYFLEQTGTFGDPTSGVTELLDILIIISLFIASFYYLVQTGNRTQRDRADILEDEYKRLYDNLPIALYRTTLDGVQIRANRTMWELEGYSSEEESVRDVIDIDSEWYVEKGRREEFVQIIREEGQIVNFESQIYIKRLDKYLWISESAYPVLDANGNILYFEGSIQDITARKLAENAMADKSAELEQMTTDLQNITNSARDVILRADRQGKINFANSAVEKIFGYTPDELIGKNVEILVKKSNRPVFWRQIQKDIATFKKNTTQPSVLSTVGVAKDGTEVITDMILSALEDENGEISYLGIIRDVTEKAKTAEFLSHMQRLDSLGLLAGGIAHDFNNLLTAILGQTTLAMRKLPNDNEVQANLEKAKHAANQAAALCRQLLAYSGKGHLQIEAIDLNALLNENLELHRIAIPKNVEFAVNLDPNLPSFLGDPSQMQQVVLNLLLNAVDALGDQAGKIEIQTEARLVFAKDSLIWTHSGRSLDPGDYAALHVTDTGIGIAPDMLEKIFDPFFTTKEEGNGLGLAGVQGIVRGHNGSILVHSTQNRGTTFSIYFPAVADPERPNNERS